MKQCQLLIGVASGVAGCCWFFSQLAGQMRRKGEEEGGEEREEGRKVIVDDWGRPMDRCFAREEKMVGKGKREGRWKEAEGEEGGKTREGRRERRRRSEREISPAIMAFAGKNGGEGERRERGGGWRGRGGRRMD